MDDVQCLVTVLYGEDKLSEVFSDCLLSQRLESFWSIFSKSAKLAFAWRLQAFDQTTVTNEFDYQVELFVLRIINYLVKLENIWVIEFFHDSHLLLYAIVLSYFST